MADEAPDANDIPLVPIPTRWGVGIAQLNETHDQYVFIRFSTAQGVQAFFLDGQSASKLAGALGQNARHVLAYEHATKGPKLIVPNENGS